jgi:tryptophanase
MSQLEFLADRISWLYKHRDLIQGLKWVEEPPVLRFFIGRLESINRWSTICFKPFNRISERINDFG